VLPPKPSPEYDLPSAAGLRGPSPPEAITTFLTLTPEQKLTLTTLHDLSGDEGTPVATNEVAARLRVSKPTAAARLGHLCGKSLVCYYRDEAYHRYGSRRTTVETFWRITTPTREHWQAIIA